MWREQHIAKLSENEKFFSLEVKEGENWRSLFSDVMDLQTFAEQNTIRNVKSMMKHYCESGKTYRIMLNDEQIDTWRGKSYMRKLEDVVFFGLQYEYSKEKVGKGFNSVDIENDVDELLEYHKVTENIYAEMATARTVSYTHLTLPTNREV